MYGAVSANANVNLGLRFLLPIYPFLFVLGGVGAAELVRRARRLGRPLLLVAIGCQLASLGRVHPDYLAYFNELVRPAEAHRYLVDSSLDWGQGLRRLARAQQARGGEPLKLSYFGTGRPEYYGVRATLLPSSMRPFPESFQLFVRRGDLVAVSATNLELLYLPRALRPLMNLLKRQQPLAAIGSEMFLYRAQFDWSLGPELASELGWLEQSIASAREKSRLEPGVAMHRSELGLALALAGRPEEARAAFQEALRIEPRVLELRPAQRRAYEALP
jgi:tetratricopeptide (TPR) repeat protein